MSIERIHALDSHMNTFFSPRAQSIRFASIVVDRITPSRKRKADLQCLLHRTRRHGRIGAKTGREIVPGLGPAL